MKDVKVPEGIEARGRNGWFKVAEATVCAYPELTWVNLYSKQRGENAPIIIQGTEVAVTKLLGSVTEALGQKLEGAEVNTILAALRYYQENGQGEPDNRSNAIHDIATNIGEDISLDVDAIDELCERLNCGEVLVI